jgi:hypothetical protein
MSHSEQVKECLREFIGSHGELPICIDRRMCDESFGKELMDIVGPTCEEIVWGSFEVGFSKPHAYFCPALLIQTPNTMLAIMGNIVKSLFMFKEYFPEYGVYVPIFQLPFVRSREAAQFSLAFPAGTRKTMGRFATGNSAVFCEGSNISAMHSGVVQFNMLADEFK